jgi:hypothetical protein
MRNRKPDLYAVHPDFVSEDGRARLERGAANARPFDVANGTKVMVTYWNSTGPYGRDAYDGAWDAEVTGHDADGTPLASFEAWGVDFNTGDWQ